VWCVAPLRRVVSVSWGVIGYDSGSFADSSLRFEVPTGVISPR